MVKISASQLSTFLGCCRRWWLIYVLKIARPPSTFNQIIGKTIHSLQEICTILKCEGKPIPEAGTEEFEKEYIKHFYDFHINKGFRITKNDFISSSKEILIRSPHLEQKPDKLRQKIKKYLYEKNLESSIRIGNFWRKHIFPLLDPSIGDDGLPLVEKFVKFKIPSLGLLIRGYVDFQEDITETKKRFIDLKILTNMQCSIQNNEQYIFYSAYHYSKYREFPEIRQDTIVKREKNKKDKTPVYVPLEAFHNINQLQILENRLKIFTQIANNASPKRQMQPSTQSHWGCSDEYCGFWQECVKSKIVYPEDLDFDKNFKTINLKER